MSQLLNEVRQEIVDLHDFFVEWFNGTADKDLLESRLVARLAPTMTFIPPEGVVIPRADLLEGFRQSHGSNKAFRIQIRDVEIRQLMDAHVLATYTEWQVGSNAPDNPHNGRLSTVLMTKGQPFEWLHVQETWLPEEVSAAGPYDF